MSSTITNRVPSLDEAAAFNAQQVVDLVSLLSREIEILKHQLDWFKRQIFGQKSERRVSRGRCRTCLNGPTGLTDYFPFVTFPRQRAAPVKETSSPIH